MEQEKGLWETLSINVDSFWLPKAASTIAPDIDAGWTLALWVSYIVFFLVVIPMVYFGWKYQRKSESEMPKPPGHNNVLEIGWSIAPFIVVMACFLVGFKGYVRASVAPADAYEVNVTAQKWSWSFTYPNGVVSPNELHIPAGVPMKMIMSSKDVLHSFYIPEFRVKQDVIPGSYTSLWFESTDELSGDATIVRALECTEYCGKDHSHMIAKVVVHSAEGFKEWLANEENPKGVAPEVLGAKLYQKNACATCHSIDGSKIVGPTFQGIFGRAEKVSTGDVVVDENYIRESILNPTAKVVEGYPPVMPSYKGQLKDNQIDALIAYMKTLK